MSLLIKNAHIVTGGEVVSGDLLAENGIVRHIGADIPVGPALPDSAGPARVIDAQGKYLLPGGVDVHTHFALDTGTARSVDDFHSGSVAAACGGVTTIVDHLGFGPKGCRLEHQIDVYHELARDAVVDYGFHGVIQHVDDAVIADMAALAARGISSCKLYLTYGYKLGDPEVLRVLERARELGMIVCVHCENDAVIRFRTRRLLAEGKKAPRHHAESRPDYCEAEAVWRMLMLARAAGDAPVYVVHLSSELGLETIRLARSRGQKNIYAETCPQYLVLDASRYDNDREGLKYIMSPPLRGQADMEALWRGLEKGDVDTIATDHCAFSFDPQKLAGLGDFTRCPNGAPGVENRMAVLFSEGFMKGRLSLPEVVRLCCTRPAQIFGLYPRKGDLLPGSDADFTLFDPEKKTVVTAAALHDNAGYTPYEGMELTGAPVLTVSRGMVIMENGEFTGSAGRGKYCARSVAGN